MSDAALFILLFGGLFVLRFIAATVVFLWILPDGVRCPNCDAATLRVESRGILKVMPWFRSSWCYECEWHGLHRTKNVSRASSCGTGAFDPPRQRNSAAVEPR